MKIWGSMILINLILIKKKCVSDSSPWAKINFSDFYWEEKEAITVQENLDDTRKTDYSPENTFGVDYVLKIISSCRLESIIQCNWLCNHTVHLSYEGNKRRRGSWTVTWFLDTSISIFLLKDERKLKISFSKLIREPIKRTS